MSIKIEDIQYGLVLGSDINTVKEALWMTWRSWVETYQKHPNRKPSWVNDYAGQCASCEHNDGMYGHAEPMDCRYCVMLEVWGQGKDELDEPCVNEGSPFYNYFKGCGNKEEASIIANAALNLLKKECYGTKEMAGPQEPNEPV